MSCFVLFFIILIFNVPGSDCDESDPCEPGDESIYPHPKECQLYYNCSLPTHKFKPWLGKHVAECDYPDLFNMKSLRCDTFVNVNCGTRARYDHACEYRENMCQEKMCRPCMSNFACKLHAGSGNKCDYTATMYMRKLTCPLDKHGVPKILDASICSPNKLHVH